MEKKKSSLEFVSCNLPRRQQRTLNMTNCFFKCQAVLFINTQAQHVILYVQQEFGWNGGTFLYNQTCNLFCFI